MIAVQLIEICWDKSARGAAGGRQRAALPRAFALQTRPAAGLVQRHRLNAWQGWAATCTTEETPPWQSGHLRAIDELALRLSDGVLQAGYLHSPWRAQPPRHPAPCVLQLPARTFGQIRLNARYTSYSGQTYVEHTWNLMWAPDPLPPNAFTARPPAVCHDARLHLF